MVHERSVSPHVKEGTGSGASNPGVCTDGTRSPVSVKRDPGVRGLRVPFLVRTRRYQGRRKEMFESVRFASYTDEPLLEESS